jgi:hypothetical protein
MKLSLSSEIYALGITFIEMLMPSIQENENKFGLSGWPSLSRKNKLRVYLEQWQNNYLGTLNSNDLEINSLRLITNDLITLIIEMINESSVDRAKMAPHFRYVNSYAIFYER